MGHKAYLLPSYYKSPLDIDPQIANAEEIKWALFSFVTTLIEKKEEALLKKFYENFIGDTPPEDPNEISNRLVEAIASKGRQKAALIEILNIARNLSSSAVDIEKVRIQAGLFELLTDFSKKKVLWRNLKKRFPRQPDEDEKAYRLRLKQWICKIKKLDLELLDNLKLYGLDPLFYQIAHVFNDAKSNLIREILESIQDAEDEGKNPEEIIDTITSLLNRSKISDSQRKSLFEAFQMHWGIWDKSSPATFDKKQRLSETFIPRGLPELVHTQATFSDFNPLVFSLSPYGWIKVLGWERFKQLFSQSLWDVVWKVSSSLKINSILPQRSFVTEVPLKRVWGFEDSKEEKYGIFAIIEWPLGRNLKAEELQQIATLIKESGISIDPSKLITKTSFKHPVRPFNGEATFWWFSNESKAPLATNNLIVIENDHGERVLRLTLEEFDQDSYIYLIVQISAFLRYWKFLPKESLYFQIYHELVSYFFGNAELFDITAQPEKYQKFFESVVLPFSKPGLELGLKPSHTLLAGLYGTSKTQFLQHLLLQKERKDLETWNNIFLNALVVPLTLLEAKALLFENNWGVRTRLLELYQNTKVPIILVIEDLDTLIIENHQLEKGEGNDLLAQALTVFMEGLGSLPIYLVTTSNYPMNFSPRLLRPNRFENIIIFERPGVEEKKQMLEEHLRKEWIKLPDDVKNLIYSSDAFKHWTASHIGAIVKRLSNYIKIQSIRWNPIQLTPEKVKEMLGDILVPKEDIESLEEQIRKRYESLKGNVTGSLGFTHS